MKNKVFIALIAVTLCFAAVVSAHEYYKTVTLYRPGETMEISAKDADEYLADGWYGQPVVTIYNPAGESSCVYESSLEEHLAGGWYTEPVILLYNSDGLESYIMTSEVYSYIMNGWSLVPPTRESFPDLKEHIELYTTNRSGDWGVYVKRMDTNEYLSINEKPYASASLIKLFNMASVYTALENGSLEMTPKISENLELMITESSNQAFNYLTRAVGGGNTITGFERDNAVIESLGCKNTRHLSELVDMAGEYAIYQGSNTTSPMDCGTVLEKIYKKELVSESASEAMLDLLKRQTRTWKIPAALPEGTVTANKTGENNRVEGDAAIVYSPACDYVLCVIGNGEVGSGVETIKNVSVMTYEYFNPAEQ